MHTYLQKFVWFLRALMAVACIFCNKICHFFAAIMSCTKIHYKSSSKYYGDTVSVLAKLSLSTELHRPFRFGTKHFHAAKLVIENLFITPRTCPTATFFHRRLEMEAEKWGSPSILKIRVPGVCYVTSQLWVKPQKDQVKVFVFVGMKDKLSFSFLLFTEPIAMMALVLDDSGI